MQLKKLNLQIQHKIQFFILCNVYVLKNCILDCSKIQISMRYPVLLFLSCLPFLILDAQNKKGVFYAYKADWSGTQNIDAATYIGQVLKENDTTYVGRYYQIEGPMVRLETYKDAASKIPNGLFIWYNKAGKVDSIGHVLNGLKNGDWFHCDNNNQLLMIVEYDSGRFVKRTDQISKRIYYADGREEDLKKRDTKMVNAIPDTATHTITTVVIMPASFDGGLQGWQTYLKENLKTPERLQSILGKKGGGKATVIAQFIIEKDGKIGDIVIDQSFEWSADMEVIRILKESPKWNPAIQSGRNVVYRHKQAFTFTVN